MGIPDWLFYSLAALFAAILVFFSLQYWPGKPQDGGPFSGAPEDGFVISGTQLNLMQTAQGLTASLMEEDGVTFLRAAAGQAPDDGTGSAGVFLTLPLNFTNAFAQTVIELSMKVRSTGPNPSPKTMLSYYALGRASSPRTLCPLTANWQACTVLWQPPKAVKKTDVDFIGIWPDLEGLSRTVDILEVRVKRLDNIKPDTSKKPAAPTPGPNK